MTSTARRRRWWTDSELHELEARWHDGWAPAVIARALGRTAYGVRHKVWELKLERGWMSSNEVARLCGWAGQQPRVAEWIRAGQLKARHRLRTGRHAAWAVTHESLEAFLRDYPHLVDRRRVEDAWRQFVPEQWIGLPEAWRRGAPSEMTMNRACREGRVPEARQRGRWWLVPESILPRLVEERRARRDDLGHGRAWRRRRLYVAARVVTHPRRFAESP